MLANAVLDGMYAPTLFDNPRATRKTTAKALGLVNSMWAGDDDDETKRTATAKTKAAMATTAAASKELRAKHPNTEKMRHGRGKNPQLEQQEDKQRWSVLRPSAAWHSSSSFMGNACAH